MENKKNEKEEENQVPQEMINEDGDGWNEEYFGDIIDAQDTLDKLGYEIRNCRRQKSPEDIADVLQKVINSLQSMKEQIEMDSENDEAFEEDEK